MYANALKIYFSHPDQSEESSPAPGGPAAERDTSSESEALDQQVQVCLTRRCRTVALQEPVWTPLDSLIINRLYKLTSSSVLDSASLGRSAQSTRKTMPLMAGR